MTRDEAIEAVTPLLPRLPGIPDHCYVSVPLGALRALMREHPLSVTPLADLEVAAVLDFGARKHADHLTEQLTGPSPALLAGHIAAIGRHLGEYQGGRRWDPETHLRTMAHVAARALLACDLDLRGSS